MNTPIVIFITAASEEEARHIGATLVEERIIACSSLLSDIQSFFFWQGNFCEENEVLLICKSVENKLDQIVTRVRELHSYDVPEIIALPITGGSKEYLDWLRASVT